MEEGRSEAKQCIRVSRKAKPEMSLGYGKWVTIGYDQKIQ